MALIDKNIESLLPNTPEWIHEMTKAGNTQQAIIAQAHLEKHGGDPTFCTVCGEDDALVFKLPSYKFRIRLCGTCKSIQESASGFKFELVE
jgi:hypothetical protein